MLDRILSMTIKEFIQVLRSRQMRFVLLVLPVVQLLVFGYAVVVDVKHIATAVCDRDQTPASRELIQRLVHSDYFDVVRQETDEPTLTRLLDTETVNAIVEIPSDFERTIRQGHTATVRVTADGTNTLAASVTESDASAIVTQMGLELAASRLRPGGLLHLEVRNQYNPALENRWFYVPGVLAVIVLVVGMNLTAMAIVREKEQGTLEQLIVTPMRPVELIAGKTLPFTLLILFVVSLEILVVRLWFGVPFRGSMATLYLGVLLFLLLALGLGLFISTISQTQQQAMLSGFFVTMPSILLSGFMFPIENMPTAVQWLTYLNPMRYFLTILRTIFLKGSGLEVLWPQYAALAGLATLVFGLSVLRFRRRLE